MFDVSLHAQLLAVQRVQLLPAHDVHVRQPAVRHHGLEITGPRGGQGRRGRGNHGGHRVDRGRHFEVPVSGPLSL